MRLDEIKAMGSAELAELDFLSLSDDELEAAKERLEELAAPKRAERLAREARRDEARAAARLRFEELVLPGLEDEYGEIGIDIALVEYAGGCLVVRRPNDVLFRKWRDDVHKKGHVTSAKAAELARPHIVHPKGAELNELLKRAPALTDAAADACYELARNKGKTDEGK